MLVSVCLTATSVWAANVTGEWTAEIPVRDGRTVQATLRLKANDGVVTGTVKAGGGEIPISAGVIDDDDVSFSVISDWNGDQTTQYFRGVVEGDIIHFSLIVERDATTSRVREFDAARVN